MEATIAICVLKIAITFFVLVVLIILLYTTCLSYHGLGDVLVLVFFGLVPTCGTYYLLTNELSWAVLLASLISGVAIDTLLIVNNYRDRDQDRLSGKRTIVVRFGEKFTLGLHYNIGVFVFIMCGLLSHQVSYKSWFTLGVSIAGLVYFWLNSRVNGRMKTIGSGGALNSCLASTSLNMLVLTLMVSLSLVLSRLI